MKTILITGAAGDVGTHLRRELAGKYVLRVSDLRSFRKINKEERFVRADISKMPDALRIRFHELKIPVEVGGPGRR